MQNNLQLPHIGQSSAHIKKDFKSINWLSANKRVN